ncbi:basement membrane-specific heparan sulfate proteoglycan core protein isoform X3 [Silurus meridionalis]|uniref:basement membrane-specific heparan sulfate proteoglycan core protein isoform X3 n=1 Tax=Silurus meridionalis TaxID=175797 RepID=UPI001EEC8E35|nr:basement membrane-specific heparan sulfate proteoglycan core protein isoform X3 [Silurus meridionalis]
MGTRTGVRKFSVLLILLLGSHLIEGAKSSKVWDEVPFPEDLEVASVPRPQRYLEDDEDFAADESSGDFISGEEDGSTPEPPVVDLSSTIYYRALVNFTDSFIYGPELDDFDSVAFQEISAAIVDTLESDYFRIPGTQTVNVVLIKQIGNDVFVELDVGSDENDNEAQIRDVLYSVVSEGSIASYVTSVRGFDFRRLGIADTTLHVEPLASPAEPILPRPCTTSEFSCQIGACIPLDFVCDNRPDCPDMSDEINCAPEEPVTLLPIPIPSPTSEVKIPPRPGPCRADQATCQNGQCISRDYLCDGDRDCSDGSDELKCGTPSPCEPNEFKCQNGRCALKLWRCDGDNDCHDNSDEINCPAKKPGDVCAPEQFQCLSDQTCIPASYQCDEEPDCRDRSDEYACAPPTVTSPPEESITAARGQTVTFTCTAVGVPIPIITWRLNWGHIPTSNRITMTSENGRGTLTIRDVKEADQGAYTCEAINAKGLVFAIPDGVLTLTRLPSNCPEGHFNLGSQCAPCYCSGITKICHSTGRYRSQISLRFTEEENFKGVNVSFPSRPGTPPPLSSTQLMVNPEEEELQLVDLSRRFLDLESYWTLPRQFLGSKVDSYGGYLKYKVSYLLQRDGSEPVDKPDVVLRGNGNRLVYRRGSPTNPNVKNQREIKFTEENWQHSSGQPVTRADLLMTLSNLESISIRTIYNNRMASVGLSDIVMDTTTAVFSLQGQPKDVEECRCPPGYSGLSCESCLSGFERVPGGPYLGTCAGCNCHGHASACDPISGHCLSCQHNTEGPQCDKCRPGYFGDPTRGRPDDCKPCPCPYTETSRRFSDTCFLDVDGQATCDACVLGYTGRRCEKCASGYVGSPLQPNGKCIAHSAEIKQCDNRGTISSSSMPCNCKANVAGTLCNECKPGSFHLNAGNPDGCLKCFCMGVTKQCASSTWTRDQVRGGVNGQLFSLANEGNTRSITEGITQKGGSEVVFRWSYNIPNDIFYWVLPENFRGDKVTAYGGELLYRVRYETRGYSVVIENKPDVVLQGNGIFLEHYSQTNALPLVPGTITVPFRESAWRRADGQPCTREHLLMVLADVSVFMIRATYADNMAESSISDIQLDIAVPHSTGNGRALEVEECACPQGYRGPSCQDCDVGYIRTSSGLYLGTCEKCECHGHATRCDSETGRCLQCQHNTAGPRCEICHVGFYGDPVTGGVDACRSCPCFGPTSGSSETKSCYLDRDGQPTCNCPVGYTGRHCERCASGYTGNPAHGQDCTPGSGRCQNCDQRGSEGCGSDGICRCKMNVEGPSCSSCKPGAFHLSPANKDGCLACFCMGVTQQCSSSSLYRDVITTVFAPGNVNGFALVNRQRTNRISTGFSVELSSEGTQLSFTNFDHHSQEPYFWQLPSSYQGDKVPAYGGKLKYTITYVPGPRGAPIDDVDVQIIGNDITLVARQDWRRTLGTRETRNFEFVFREEYWQRPDGMPATREHLLMVLAHMDDILIRASYYTGMRSSSISGVSMEIAVPHYTSLGRALEVEQCRCPPGYQGLSCQDCAQGYTRTGGGLYLGHCELCECNGHSDTCHPETGVCTGCLHNTMGEMCDQCAAGFFGDASAGTPEDCQPCACPHTDPENQFSPTCESLGNGDYRCTACQTGYMGQYCERCAPGYVGNPHQRVKCRPYDAAAPLVVRVYPERVQVSQGSSVTLRCQGSGPPPHYFYWTRDAGRPISSSAERRKQGEELHFSSVQTSDAGVYTCTCRNQLNTNRSQAEIIITTSPSKPIEVFIEEPKFQNVIHGATVNFICTAKSKFPAYTLVWTRQGSGKLPDRAMDFNGILTIRNVRPEDAGVYVCTGSNMFAMDEGTAVLNVPDGTKAEMFFTAYEMFEGHRQPGELSVKIQPPVRTVQQGQSAEFRCTATGNPPPSVEWTGGLGKQISSSAIIRGGVLTFPSVQRSDEGDYICRAINTQGEQTARATLYIYSSPADKAVKPTVTIQPPVLRAQQGTRVEFLCTATGNPTPSIEWTGGPGNRISASAVIRGGVLTFPSVERSDEGDYTCRAFNTHGEHATRAVLYVFGSSAVEEKKPTVTIDQPVLTVKKGQRAELRCTATGNPAPSIEWTGPGNQISSSAIIRDGVLIFPSAESTDEGEYTCRAFNTHGEHAARLVLYVQSSFVVAWPRVTIQPPVITIQQGQRAEFRCTATGNPAPSVEWTGGPGNRISSSAIIQGGVLTFPSVQRSDEGDYTCRAFNTHGEHSARAVLYVHSASLPHVQVSPQRVEIHEGETLRLYCRAGGSPSPGLTWKRRGGTLPPQAIPSHGFHQFKSNSLDALQRRIDEMQARVERTDYGTLLIPNMKPSDGGTYLCIGTNSIGSSEAVIEVTVLKGEIVPSDVTIQSTTSTVLQGETLELNCVDQGNSSPSVTWSRANAVGLSTKFEVVGSKLRILQATPEDSGEYICRVDNDSNPRQTSIYVSVISEAVRHQSPIISIEPHNIIVYKGEAASFRCRLHAGAQPVRMEWKLSTNQPLQDNVQVSPDGSVLTISSAQPVNQGAYRCVASNPYGVTHSIASLIVRELPKTTVTPTGPVRVNVGKPIKLECKAAGEPQPSVTWHKLDNNRRMILKTSDPKESSAVMEILVARPENSGTYICTSQNSQGRSETRVEVIVEGGAQVPSVPSVPRAIAREPLLVVVEGAAAVLHCDAHGFPKPTITWSKGIEPLPLRYQLVNNSLVIQSVRQEDSGTYTCTATNPMGTSQVTVRVNVEKLPKANVTPTGPVRVNVGEPIFLECQGAGEPQPSVIWHRLDNPNPVPKEYNAVMQILVARPEDSGTYICTAQNSQGRSETRVEVIVEGGDQVPTAPRAIARDPLLVVVEGAAAVLHCDAHGFPKPVITWSKLRAPLPWRHKIVNNELILPSVGRQDSGTYICNATNDMGTSEVTVMVDVETPPYTTTLPDDVAVRVGEVIRLQCIAHGTPPMQFEWSKVNGNMPARVEVQGGDLQINLASPSDAGSYKCVVSNKVGRSEAVAKVSVRSPLSVRVSPQVEVKALGSAVEFTCSASGGPEVTLEWLKEGETLPHNHHIKDGVLRIENLEKSNEGMYICRATTLFGQAQDTAKLTIQALPKVMINVRTSVQTVTVGTSVEFECYAEGDPVPTVRWSKVGAPLPDHVQVKGAMLRIERVMEVDAGQYRCTATNNVGSVQTQVVLNIQSLPQIAAQPDTKEVTVGSTAIFPCIATGYPVPNITWSKRENELPPKCFQDAHVLTVPNVSHEDSGTYVCTASNKQGKVEAFTKLNVHERVMPYFSQEPLSYLRLPTIKSSYKAFKINITFRPDNVDGMILYNGQKKAMGADFISLGLVGGRPEFRFDVGSGMASIRYPTAIKLGEFHTVQLYRNGTHGSITVDKEAPVSGTSQGKFQGLDLNEELYVGGYPNYSMIAKTSELKSGFVGCIKQLIIQGEEVIFKDLEKSSTGVTDCPTCKDHPCQNGGVCRDARESLYKCTCPRGFTGSNCQHLSSEHCHPEACGPDATCINRPGGVGYDCRCHLGKYGHKCMGGLLVTMPLFDGDESYIVYPPLTNIHNDLRIDMEFKPMDKDGLMFFLGGKKVKVEDFVALSLVEGHVEFRYELGTGQAVLRSPQQVSLGEWHYVTAERFNQDGVLKLDDGPEVRKSSPGKSQGLNVHTAMFLGGVPKKDILPKPANVSMFFEGCIGEVSINGKKIDLSYTFIESRAISQCIDNSPCDRKPCQHGGTCMQTAEYEFQCLCMDGYEGDRCEVVKDTCVDSSQCHNGGSCVNSHCVCAAGYTGVFCRKGQKAVVLEAPWNLEASGVNDSPIQYAAFFHDDGYLSLPKAMFPRSSPVSPETIELEINTISEDGLILWQGVEPAASLSLHKSHTHNKVLHKQTLKQESGDQGRGKDFISLGLHNGHLVFSYQLGSGEAEILSKERINDGHWHKITAVRTGKQGYVQVDDRAAQHGESPGRSVMVNTKGSIYLGGAPDMATLTGSKFYSGITGCVKNLSLLNVRPGEQPSRPIDLQLHAEGGKNVQRCTS